VAAVVGAAVPAVVCRWGLCPCCPGVGRCLSGVYNHHHIRVSPQKSDWEAAIHHFEALLDSNASANIAFKYLDK